MEKEIFIVGKIRLNGNNSPCVEICLDNADGRAEGEIVLLKEIANEDRDAYIKKIIRK